MSNIYFVFKLWVSFMYYWFILFFSGVTMAEDLSKFVSIAEYCPGIEVQADYSTKKNFTGSIVRGYKTQKAYLALIPARALCKVHTSARTKGFGLKVFDAYRPVKAVESFQDWAKFPEDNHYLKELYYPRFSRLELFEKGFIAKKSSHSRGSAIDLTLYDLKTGVELDMGSRFDFFDEISHTESPFITKEQQMNRRLLKDLMELNGFKNFSQEWWHFSYRAEPYPDQYFDFDVE
jgi:D-alanyl-D-alanine dipeptidase